MPSRKGSSRRKPVVIRHITAQENEESDELPEIRLDSSDLANDEPEKNKILSAEKQAATDDTNEDVTEIEDNEDVIEELSAIDRSSAASEEEKLKGMVNGSNNEKVKITTDDKGNAVLPDGTLVLQPAEVSENDEFSGPEFKSRSKKVVKTEMEGTFKCTSCHEQLNPNNPKQVSKHKLMGVLLCRHCSKFLSSGNFDIDDEGSEDQCMWCGEGGNLICCDDCPKAFCRSCIKTNLGRKELRSILDNENWLCYVCNPAPLAALQEDCEEVMYYIKKQSEAKAAKTKPLTKVANKSKNVEKENELLKVMQLIGGKSSSKELLDGLVKSRSPKGLRHALNLFKDLRKISADLEHRIRDELDEEEDEVEEDKSSKTSDSEKGKDKKGRSKRDAKSDIDNSDEDEKNKKKSHKKKDESEKDKSEEESEDSGRKSPNRQKKTKIDKHDKAASSSPSEDDVPGTSNGSVKGNKSGRKGRRSLFKAQQKERTPSSSSDEDSESESSADEDSDWEEESGVKDRRRRKASKKGKAGGKLAAKKGKGSSSDSDGDSGNNDKKKRKKNKNSSLDSEIEFLKKKKKKKKKHGLGKDSSNLEEDYTEDDRGQKKKKENRTKKSKEGDISLSSDSDEESDGGESGDSSAEEVRRKIKRAKQDAEKGTKENKQELDSDTEDKIAERLLMEEVEEESRTSETSDSDLDDAKKKRDRRKNKKDRKIKNKSDSEDEVTENDKKNRKRKNKSGAEDEDTEKDKKSRKRKNKSGSEDEDTEMDKNSRKRKDKSGSEDEDTEKDKKSRKRKNKCASEDEDTEKDKKSKKKKKKTHHLLQVKISESESEEDLKKKKKKKKPKKRVSSDDDLMTSAESSSSSSSESDVQPKKKTRKRKSKKDESSEDDVKRGRSYMKKGKRRRIKVASATESTGSDTTDEDVSGKSSGSDNQDTPGRHRKQIRKVLKKSKLLKTTVEAELAEKERRERIKARRKALVGDEESIEECASIEELVLEYGKNKKKKLLEVDKNIVSKLKPHQVEGVQFMWDSTFETLEKKDEEGGGCILAHCMGLGKTLQVITYLHTIMTHPDLEVKSALVVAPLNTVLNWVDEFNKWLTFDDSIDVYELTSIKNNDARADMLEQWHEEGGVLVMGYAMYRILSYNPKLKRKRLKRIFHTTLVEPGPDVVVCDEGHMLKNDVTAIAKALNSIRTKRRICLTGTPLQNNLVEYHCMVNFVKPNLLGTQKEYKNRFVNPITNGQCSDSTSRDVRIMKHRAHILHDLLAGCVQRKDYSVITKFLPPKHEYVISIRLSKEQIKLYEVYLGDQSGMKKDGDNPEMQQRSTSVFADYQSLMRIWTHPQVLKLNTIREDRRAFNDMNTFVTSEDETDTSSVGDFIDDEGSSSDGCREVSPVELPEENGRRPTRSSRRTRQVQNKNIPSSDEGNKKEEADSKTNVKKSKSSGNKSDGHRSDSSLEIIKSWKTRSRAFDPDGADTRTPTPTLSRKEWYDEYFDPEKDAYNIELSGKLNLLLEILKHCESIGEKILVFSQSLLSLDLIEDFLENLNQQAEDAREKGEQDLDNQIGGTGAWIKGEDYFRMDGSTAAHYRQRWCDIFNNIENMRARLFLISTKSGSLGINLVGANRVIIFDASWNPSHDTQSIFRVYRFGQTRAVFIYRFVAQGTMEEKIYERQVAKQSLSQRVVDEHQIERHFTAGQLSELYSFTPDRLDDPDRVEPPTPALPKDHILAELLKDKKEWIVNYHEHDSLLENKVEEELSEADRKAAWDEYNAEKEGRLAYMQAPQIRYPNYGGASAMMLQNLYRDGSKVLQAGQDILGDQYTNVTLNGYNPYGWAPNAYNSQAINGVQYRVPVPGNNKAFLMRQYQALQQQRERNYSLMQQQQQQQQHAAAIANHPAPGNQSISQLLTSNYAGRPNPAANYQNSMSNLLSQMAGGGHISNIRGMSTPALYNTLKKQAEQQKANGTASTGKGSEVNQ